MKNFALWTISILFVAAVSLASAETKVKAEAWKSHKEYDVRTLAHEAENHVGETVAVKFNFRGKDIHHIKPNWYEGSIWQTDPNGKKKGFSDVRVLVAKKDLDAFKALTGDSTASQELTVYGHMELDFDSRFVFIRVHGTKAAVDSAGNAVISW